MYRCGCEYGADCTRTTMCTVQSAIEDLEYRHECLKMMWDDEVNNIIPDTADKDIDTYICEQGSHS